MANKTITQLDTITPAGADEIPIWDISEGTTGKATLKAISSITNLSIVATSTTFTGRPLTTNTAIKVIFTVDIIGSDTSTALSFTYNGTAYNVKVGKYGSLSDVYAHEVSSGVYKYIQAWTTLELVYDGAQFIIVGNPIVISTNDYTIYANGKNIGIEISDSSNISDTSITANSSITLATSPNSGNLFLFVLSARFAPTSNYSFLKFSTDIINDFTGLVQYDINVNIQSINLTLPCRANQAIKVSSINSTTGILHEIHFDFIRIN